MSRHVVEHNPIIEDGTPVSRPLSLEAVLGLIHDELTGCFLTLFVPSEPVVGSVCVEAVHRCVWAHLYISKTR